MAFTQADYTVFSHSSGYILKQVDLIYSILGLVGSLPSLPLTLLTSHSDFANNSLIRFAVKFLLNALALCSQTRKSDSRLITQIAKSFFSEGVRDAPCITEILMKSMGYIQDFPCMKITMFPHNWQ